VTEAKFLITFTLLLVPFAGAFVGVLIGKALI
jgi:hypothetical protein